VIATFFLVDGESSILAEIAHLVVQAVLIKIRHM
jgi:hypothetical protein